MRVIVMGTGPFAVPALQGILEQGHDIPFAVTRPASPTAGKKAPARPVAEWAQLHGISIYEPSSINDIGAIDYLSRAGADLFFVCDYGQILSRDCLATARLGGINLHGSLLPRHRGAAPVQWTLLSGDPIGGVTVIHMTPRLDAGPALAIRSAEIFPDETAGELEPRLAELGVDATLEALEKLSHWDGASAIGSVQDSTVATRAPRFSKHHGELDFRLPAEYLVRLVRACQPWPGTFAELQLADDRILRVLVRAARHWNGTIVGLPGPEEVCPPGTVFGISSRSLECDWPTPWDEIVAVRSGSGWFLIGKLQPAGKREMSAAEFLRGHSLPPGGGAQFLLPAVPLQQLQA
jgi:methionyl-tRNA formyltransferase